MLGCFCMKALILLCGFGLVGATVYAQTETLYTTPIINDDQLSIDPGGPLRSPKFSFRLPCFPSHRGTLSSVRMRVSAEWALAEHRQLKHSGGYTNPVSAAAVGRLNVSGTGILETQDTLITNLRSIGGWTVLPYLSGTPPTGWIPMVTVDRTISDTAGLAQFQQRRLNAIQIEPQFICDVGRLEVPGQDFISARIKVTASCSVTFGYTPISNPVVLPPVAGLSAEGEDPDTLACEFTAVKGEIYDILCSSDGMATWQTVESAIKVVRDFDLVRREYPIEGSSRFYRIVASRE